MRNFIKAELYLTLKNKAYRVLFAVGSAFLLMMNFLVSAGRAADATDSELFRGRIQGFAFIFVFGIMGIAIVSVIALGDLGKGGAVKNVISNGLNRWKYIIGKIAITAIVLIVYILLFFIIHLGISTVLSGTEAFVENIPAILEFLMVMCWACFFWLVWLTVLIAFELLIPNVGFGAIVGLFVAMNGASSILLLLAMKIPAIQQQISYVAVRLPSGVLSKFFNTYLYSTSESLFNIPAPDLGSYLVGGAVAILMTAIGILSFRRREL